MKKNGHLEWKVKYAPGAIEASGSSGGKVVLTERRETAGAASRLVIETSKADAAGGWAGLRSGECAGGGCEGADGADGGRYADVSVEGPGKVIGVGNGDPSCHEPDKASQRSAFMGLAAGFVQAGTTAGEVQVKVTAKGLEAGEITLRVGCEFWLLRQFDFPDSRKVRWSQWVNATLSSDPHSLKTKSKSAG